MIHKSSEISSKAKISKNVKIGPFCYVGPDVILEEDVELIEKHFPDDEIVQISNAGHWVHAENPQDFFDEVSRFLIYY